MHESEVVKVAVFRLRELAAQMESLAAQATSEELREVLRSVSEAVRDQERQISNLVDE